MTRTTGWDVSRVLLPQGKSYTNEHELESELIAEE